MNMKMNIDKFTLSSFEHKMNLKVTQNELKSNQKWT